MHYPVVYPSKFFRVGFVLVAAIGAIYWYGQAVNWKPSGNTVVAWQYENQLAVTLFSGVAFIAGLAGALISNSLFKVPTNYVAFHHSGSVYNDGWKFLPFCGVVGVIRVTSPSQRIITLQGEKVRLYNGTEVEVNASAAWSPDQENLAPFIKATEAAIIEAASKIVRSNIDKVIGNYHGTWRDLRAEQTTIEKEISSFDNTPRQFGIRIEYVKLTITPIGKTVHDPEPVSFSEKFDRARARLRELREKRNEAEADGASDDELEILDHLIEAEKAKLKESL